MARKLRRKPIDNTVLIDMTPMIDIVFLLLIFFMLTTKFTPDEKAITSLMPTDKGQAQATSQSPIPKEQINIKIYPRSPTGPNLFSPGFQPSNYRDALAPILADRVGRPIDNVIVQVGGSPPVPIEGQYLSMAGGEALTRELNNFTGAITQGLAERDNNATSRKDAPPVIIHCFSRLSWKYALLAYDSVRKFEADNKGAGIIAKNAELANAREVTFAPPRIRNYSANEDGNELYEIIHLQ